MNRSVLCRLRLDPVLLLLWLVLNAPGAVVLAQPQFDRWTVDDGLPQNSVNAITQTRDGYLWIATNEGLARFDGARFRVFHRGNTPGFTSSRLASLFEDSDGTLWIGSYDGVLIALRDGVFTSYDSTHGLPSDEFLSIESDSEGSLWINGGKSTIVRWRAGRAWTLSPGKVLPGRVRPMLGNQPWWSVDSAGLHIFSAGKVLSFNTAQGLPGLDVQSVYLDSNGLVWINTKAGLARLKDNTLRKVEIGNSFVGIGMPGVVHESRSGDLWIAGETIRRLRGGALKAFPSVSGGLFFEDREGSLWIGSADGLLRVRELSIVSLTTRDGLGSDLIYSVLATRNGDIWIGSWGNGATRLRGDRMEHFVPGHQPGLFSGRVTSLYEDRSGRLWIGTYGGVSRFERETLVRFSSRRELAETWTIHEDRSGRFWFGSNEGLLRLDRDGFTHFTTAHGLPHLQVNAIFEDRSGNLWIGTQNGLARLQSDKIVPVPADGFTGWQIRCFYEDRDGAIWIGSYDGGLVRLKDGQLSRITAADGLYSDGVFQLLEDDAGNFWMTCNRGIYRVRKSELDDFAAGHISRVTSVSYGTRDGMLNPECNGGRQPAGSRMSDGKLWFPTMRGIAIVDPRGVQNNNVAPSIVIEGCRLNQESVDCRSGLEIRPGKENLEIEYTGVSFIKPEQVRFRYKLSPWDRDWVEAGARRSAYYSHIAPGEYQFTVLAANSDGVWNEAGKSLRVVVQPAFWRTRTFLGVVLMGLLGVLAAGYGLRRRQLKQKERRREAFERELIDSQERDRERIASDLHSSLNQCLLTVKNRALLGRNSAHDERVVKLQFVEIDRAASIALEEARRIAHDLRPDVLQRRGLSAAVAEMAETTASVTGLRFTTRLDDVQALLSKEAADSLFRVIQECINNIVKHSGASDVNLEIIAGDGTVKVKIQDNGVGFDPQAVLTRGSFGLRSIANRVHLLGGTHSILTEPHKGTTILIAVSQSISDAAGGGSDNE